MKRQMVSVHTGWRNAPFGREMKWDAEMTDEWENEHISWRSLPGSVVNSTGSVHFSNAPGGRGTIVHVSMQYNPPAGSIGRSDRKAVR